MTAYGKERILCSKLIINGVANMFKLFSKAILIVSVLISLNLLAQTNKENIKEDQFSVTILDSNKNSILKYEGSPRQFKIDDLDGVEVYLDFFQVNQINTKEKALAIFLSKNKETEKFYFTDTSKAMEGYLADRKLQVLITKLN